VRKSQYTSVILVVRLRQDNQNSKASQGYIRGLSPASSMPRDRASIIIIIITIIIINQLTEPKG
jgi:hypothetical protein